MIAASGEHAETELRRRFAAVRWDRPPSWDGWRREVEAAKRTGYGVDIDQYILGVTVISAPVTAEGRASHALVVVGLSERLRDRADGIGAELRRLAEDVSRRLDE